MSRRAVDRLACVNIAALPLQILLRAEPAWRAHPTVVVEDDRPQSLVLFLNTHARKLGIRSGQRYATALALARELRAGTVAQIKVEQHVETLTHRLRKFSPNVEPSAQTPGIFWLDVSGLQWLYASLDDWAKSVRSTLHSDGFASAVAVGFTRFGVYAITQFHRGASIFTELEAERTAAARVPLAYIDIDPNARERLSALGIETVGAFLELPAGSIRHRFGAATDALYQLALGERGDVLHPVAAPERFMREVHFDAPEKHADRLIFIVKRLLDSLLSEVAAKAYAVVELELRMKLDTRAVQSERVRPAMATVDAAVLLNVVRLRLDALMLPSGIATLQLTAETCPASAHQRRLFEQHARRSIDAAAHAFALLRAEFHERVVVRAKLADGHLPSARFTWEPIDGLPQRTSARVVAARPLVRRMLSAPMPIPQSAIDNDRQRLGPFIVSGGWWNRELHRAYFFVSTKDGRMRWVYYDQRTRQYYVQGSVE